MKWSIILSMLFTFASTSGAAVIMAAAATDGMSSKLNLCSSGAPPATLTDSLELE